MKRQILALGLLLSCAFATVAAVPPPEKLLPSDTVAVLTVPDYAKSSGVWKQAPVSQLWADPALKPFKDKFMTKFQSEFVDPLEKQLGVKFSEYLDLAQGQVTFALTANDWNGAAKPKPPGVLVLIDAKDKADGLKSKLATLKTKWVDGGQQVRVEKIRDVEFTALIFKADELKKSLNKALPGSKSADEALEPPKPGDTAEQNMELIVGQSGSLLVIGTEAKQIEKLLANQAGSGSATLSENAAFASDFGPNFRDAQIYGWLNVKSIMDTAMKAIAADSRGQGGRGGGMGPKPDQIFGALGLTGLQAVSFNLRDNGDGQMMGISVGVPESQRRGLFKMFSFEAKDANPPAFVPADVVKFSRIRLDLQKTWAALEAAVTEAVPQAGTLIKMMMENAGKDKDPNFDLRKNLIANLGDDVINYQKAPRNLTLADLNSPPSLILIGSPRAEQVASAIQALGAVMPQPKVKEREFLGRTVYALGLPPSPGPNGKMVERTLHYAGSGGYVAMSADVAMLEEFLRNGDSTAKALRDAPGLREAAQKVGGMATGLFGYGNAAETARVAVEVLKKDSGNLASLFGGNPMAGQLEDSMEKFQDWVDFSLLPSFDKIAKYFHITVASGAVTSQGMSFKVYSPNPPQLKK